jgi:hypothetical protein
MAPVAPLRAALSPLVSRAASGPSAIASDSRDTDAGTAPRSPDNETSLPPRWLRATTDKSSREAFAGTRQRRRSLADTQFLDPARIRRYTASSGEHLLLFSSGHGARSTTFAATFLLRPHPGRSSCWRISRPSPHPTQPPAPAPRYHPRRLTIRQRPHPRSTSAEQTWVNLGKRLSELAEVAKDGRKGGRVAAILAGVAAAASVATYLATDTRAPSNKGKKSRSADHSQGKNPPRQHRKG